MAWIQYSLPCKAATHLTRLILMENNCSSFCFKEQPVAFAIPFPMKKFSMQGYSFRDICELSDFNSIPWNIHHPYVHLPLGYSFRDFCILSDYYSPVWQTVPS
jgi:hypothetical protein